MLNMHRSGNHLRQPYSMLLRLAACPWFVRAEIDMLREHGEAPDGRSTMTKKSLPVPSNLAVLGPAMAQEFIG